MWQYKRKSPLKEIRKPFMMPTLNRHGFLNIPLCICYTAFALMLFGTLGLLRRERHLVETQLRLDRCVEKTAINLHKTLNKIEDLNKDIRMTSAELMVDIEPNSRIALQIKLSADVMAQEMIVRSWPKNQAQWIAQQGCD
ncbi:MAG: hypothetical protein HY843_05185, partial [Bdellovibrio sp.]|nr:hypothetical protein [Bdellovibrio sp.]